MFMRNFTHIVRASRGLATHAPSTSTMLPAVLHLKTGQSFKGRSFGAPRSIFGETVFSTSITSCKFRLVLMTEIVVTHTQSAQIPNR